MCIRDSDTAVWSNLRAPLVKVKCWMLFFSYIFTASSLQGFTPSLSWPHLVDFVHLALFSPICHPPFYVCASPIPKFFASSSHQYCITSLYLGCAYHLYYLLVLIFSTCLPVIPLSYENILSGSFAFNKGVKQGDGLLATQMCIRDRSRIINESY